MFKNSSLIAIDINYNVDLLTLDDLQRNKSKSSILLSIGRPFQGKKNIEVSINSIKVNPPLVYDGCGGYWLNLSFNTFHEDSSVIVSVENNHLQVPIFTEPDSNITQWINPSRYIDSDNLTLISLALNLTKNLDTTMDKVDALYNFMITQIGNQKMSSREYENASAVYKVGYGVCRHKARLFVALCRAVAIPARTIEGILCATLPIDSGHQWAEYMTDNGSWIQIDPTNRYFSIADSRFFDVYYAPYQNPFSPSSLLISNDSSMSLGNYLEDLTIRKVTRSVFSIEFEFTVELFHIISLIGFGITSIGIISLIMILRKQRQSPNIK